MNSDKKLTRKIAIGIFTVLVPAFFEDGKDALDKSNGVKIDMVITDLNMPEMDGIALIKSLRGASATRFTPIVMLTTESQAGKQEEGKKAGVSGWIVKPFSPKVLLETVNKFAK